MGYNEYMTLYDPIFRWVLVGSRWILGTEVLLKVTRLHPVGLDP
jgi:hypothetical protein